MFIAGLVLGLFVGAWLSVLIMALCIAGRREEE